MTADVKPLTRTLRLASSGLQGKLKDVPEEPSTIEVPAGQMIRMQGELQIKVKPPGNKALDNWEEVFAVLEKETLSLYTDRAAAAQGTTRWPPINIVGAVCKDNPFYRRKENTFKVILEDSHFMFAAPSGELQQLWLSKLQNRPEACSSDSEDSGRASSVNLSLEKLTEAAEDVAPPTYTYSRTQSLERQLSSEGQRPPKPPHTYYNRHRYPEGGEGGAIGFQRGTLDSSLVSPDNQAAPPLTFEEAEDNGNQDKAKKVRGFRKFFSKK
ncbi:uncharacterized protein LOC112487100 [Cynoglossus semilaevis]|uniref:uncharacterized protein LOC112487100 n=1 Tax=Cynoglossus semilaevis TaxID=244447 RepID=UPI000D623E12|nr:uncharacterized protein LOC112487100 [Cynoglossus semilaevis]